MTARSPLPSACGGYEFGERTFAGVSGDDEDAPIPSLPTLTSELKGSTHSWRPKAKQHPSRTCKTLVRSSPRATGIYVVAASFVSALHWPHLLASFQQCPQWGIAGDCQCACKMATLRRLPTFEAR